jgi:adenylate cyclase class 2
MTPKSALETELKLRIPATAPFRPRLAAQGFTEVAAAQREQSTLWDREGTLLASGSALRTRSFAGTAILTWKGPKVPDALLKIRPERETPVADGEALEAILRALGFEPVLRMEKTRALWRRQDLEACLDETPFGCYLELEGEAQAIHGAMEGLGLTREQAEPRSYPELYRLHGLGAITAPR